jgi:hypothetical protein
MARGLGAVIIDRFDSVPHVAYPGSVAWVWVGENAQAPDDAGFRAEPGAMGGTEWLLPLPAAEALVAANAPVGLWAYEALRIAAGVPRTDLDLAGAPKNRRLAVLLLEGDTEHLPAIGAPIISGGPVVGRLGTSAHHYELGPIALAVLKPSFTTTPEPDTVIIAKTFSIGSFQASVWRLLSGI